MRFTLRKILFFFCWMPFTLNAQTAAFTANTTSGCDPVFVQFTDNSTGANIVSWNWTRDGNSFSTLQDPGLFFTTPGVFEICLTVANNLGASDTHCETDYITVFDLPTANFSSPEPNGCNPHTVSFLDQSILGDAAIMTWRWDFGDGVIEPNLQNPIHTYTTVGTFDVTLLVTDLNGCEHSLLLSDFVTISETPVSDFTADVTSACNPPHTVNFTSTSTPIGNLGFTWDFGNGMTSTATNPSTTYNSNGSYDVSLISYDLTTGCADTILYPGLINIGTVVDFSVSTMSTCVNTAIQFTDLTPGSSVSNWMWDFGDGNTSTQQNPSHSYTAPGCYFPSLTATSDGCTSTFTFTNCIQVDPAPTANYSSSNTLACEFPFTVNFNDLSIDAQSWNWNFGDGSTSMSQNPSHTYTAFGSYPVILQVTNADGCTDVAVIDTVVIEELDVLFTNSISLGCAPLSVDFFDITPTPNSTITSWFWEFGDGNTSTVQNPNNVYTDTGDYTVTLTVTNDLGCSDTLSIPNYIQVGIPPMTNFGADVLTACLEDPIQFTDSSNALVDTWFWEFGDGGTANTQDPMHIYTDTGMFTVSLVTSFNGCLDTLTLVDYITIFPPEASFEPFLDCDNPYTVMFADSSVGPVTDWHWDFGVASLTNDTSNLQNPTYTYDSTGTYTVTLSVFNSITGCADMFATNITVADVSANFSLSPIMGCAPLVVSIADSSIDVSNYQWTAPGSTSINGNTSITYANAGIYSNIQLIGTDVNGCADTISVDSIISVSEVDAGFFPDAITGCTPMIVTFTDTSTTTLGDITSVSWSFGSTDSIAMDTFTSPGNYNITLTATNSLGCTDTETQFVQPTFPLTFFTSDTLICSDQIVQFNNLSSGLGLNYLWNFGDGNSSTAVSPSHQYAMEGNYQVCLTATDFNGCDSTYCSNQLIQVINPLANFSADTLFATCPPLEVTFADSSINAVSWFWSFGDGSVSTLQTPSHVYTTPGFYEVSLIVEGTTGCFDTLTVDSLINLDGPTGTFDFTPDIGCSPLEVTFTGQSDDAIFYTWVYDDGNFDIHLNNTGADTSTYTYTNAQQYFPTLLLEDALGCQIFVESPDPIQVENLRVDFFSNDSLVCESGNVNLISNISSTAGISSINWQFTGASPATSTIPNPTVFIDGSAPFDATLIVTNTACTDTFTRTDYISIVENPTADFLATPDAGCLPLSVSFQDLSTSNSGTISDWLWDFDHNGDTSMLQSPNYTFDTAAILNPSLIVTTEFGCSDTVSYPIEVYPLPTADAGSDLFICLGDSIQLNGSESGSSIILWQSTAPLNNTAILNPTTWPSVTTDYILTTNTVFGCTVADTMTVFVNNPPVIDLGPDQVICIGDSFNLASTITGSGALTYLWESASSISCTSCQNPTFTPQSTTTYYITVTDNVGCFNTDSIQISVNPLPVISLSPNSTICFGDSTVLSASISNPISYDWFINGVFQNSGANISVSPSTTTNYEVVATNANGCVNRDTVLVTVNTLPPVDAGPNTSICIGSNTQLNATGGTTYLWSPNLAISNINIANPIVNPTTTTVYSVTITDDNGCSNSDQVTITVNPLPIVDAGSPQIVCTGDSVMLNALATSLAGFSSYSWSPSTTIDCATCLQPNVFPTSTTTYTLTATDNNGCIGVDSVVVTAIPLPNVIAGIDSAICIGESVTLSASGAISYSWTPTDSLSNPLLSNPNAFPIQTTSYIVSGADANGCVNTDTTIITVHQLPLANAGPDESLCIGDSVQLAATGGIQYDWSNQTGLNNYSIANPIATPLVSTVYVVTVTDIHGCTANDTIEVTVNPLPTVNAGVDVTICIGDTTQLSPTVSGSGTIQYLWSSATSLSCNTCEQPFAFPTTTTTYYLSITDSNTCQQIDSITVFVNPAPIVSITQDTIICIGETLQLQASGGVAYSWSPAGEVSNAFIANPIVSPTITGNYMVTVTDQNGCTASEDVLITVNPLPTISAGNGGIICIGDSLQLNAAGGNSYSWTPVNSIGNANSPTPWVFPIATTVYQVMGTDINGCQNTDTVTVVVNPLPTVNAGLDVSICSGGNTTLNPTANGSGNLQYMWSPAGDLSCANCENPIATPSLSTMYYLTVEDANGCSDIDSVFVSVEQLPSPNILPDSTICIGSSIQLWASGGVNYSWSAVNQVIVNANSAMPTVTPTATDVYTVTVTDVNGCSAINTTTITVNNLPIVDAGPSGAICTGQTYQLQASGAVNYSWSPSLGLTNPNIANPVANPGVTTLYTVIGTDAFGCQNTDTVTLTVFPFPAPNVTLTSDTLICDGDWVQLFATGGNSFSDYQWDTSLPGLSCYNCENPFATPDTTTTYFVTVTGQGGCTTTASVEVSVFNDNSLITSSDRVICSGDSVQISVGGVVSALWSGDNRSCTNCLTTVVFPSETTEYTVVATSSAGCILYDTVLVEVLSIDDISAGEDQTICFGDTVQLLGLGQGIVNWTPSNLLNADTIFSPTTTPTTTTTYVMSLSNDLCYIEDSVTIEVVTMASITTSDGIICEGDTIQLVAEGNANSFNWTPIESISDPNSAMPFVSPGESQEYQVIGYLGDCVPDTAYAYVEVQERPDIELNDIVNAFPDEQVQLDVNVTNSGNWTYNWTPFETLSCSSCPDPILFADTSRTLTVTVSDDLGCSAQDSIMLRILTSCDEDIVVVPNAFSPNNDGLNDILYVRGRGASDISIFRIFNRWGEIVFESNDLSVGWDGRLKGEPVNSGVYVYYVSVPCPEDGSTIIKKGNVTLLK